MGVNSKNESSDGCITTYGIIKEAVEVLWPFFFFHLSVLSCVGRKTIKLNDLWRYQYGRQLER